MNEHIENAVASTKDFVSRHKTKLAVIATATICLALNRAALSQHNDFLKEHDLYDEFYLATDED